MCSSTAVNVSNNEIDCISTLDTESLDPMCRYEWVIGGRPDAHKKELKSSRAPVSVHSNPFSSSPTYSCSPSTSSSSSSSSQGIGTRGYSRCTLADDTVANASQRYKNVWFYVSRPLPTQALHIESTMILCAILKLKH